MSIGRSVDELQHKDSFEEHAIDTIQTLLLNDSTMPMTFLCETSDDKQILILYFMTDQIEIENEINMVRALMLLNNVERYIFAAETLIPSDEGLPSHKDKKAKDGLVFLHANQTGLQKVTQYFIRHKKGVINLTGKTTSDTLETNTNLSTLLLGPHVSSEQRKELEMIISTLPKNYPVKAFEYSESINTYQQHTLN